MDSTAFLTVSSVNGKSANCKENVRVTVHHLKVQPTIFKDGSRVRYSLLSRRVLGCREVQSSMDPTFIVVEGSIGQQLSRFVGNTRSTGLHPEIKRIPLT